jgi:phosphoribosylanthranilate isomerase
MKYIANREAIEKLPVDWLGFIFYPQSKRFIGETPERGVFDSAKEKVGVFVNQNAFEIMSLSKKYQLDWIQLHGSENPQTCRMLIMQGLKIIKAFSVDEDFDFETTAAYEKTASLFLFDTKTPLHGGSGKKFNWTVLEKYTGHLPFLLSGGIGPDDAEEILKINHPKLTGIDVNSGFEDEPGVKNIEKLKDFINKIQTLRNSV